MNLVGALTITPIGGPFPNHPHHRRGKRMARKEFTPKTKREAFKRSDGICEANRCSTRILRTTCEYDHILPDALGGDNSLSNCACLCKECHSVKTNGVVGDKFEIAKRRRQAKRQGKAKQRRGQRLQSRGFDKTLSRKFNGSVVARTS